MYLQISPIFGWGVRLGLAGVVVGSAITSLSFANAFGNAALAQVVPDNTLGGENSVVTSTDSVDTISGGATRGGNLFHSFDSFSVLNGRTASFDNATNIQNILTRVTGGSISNIDGLIRANGAANLFLLNPNGIIFGQNARLDLRGSFVGTTANAFQFGNQGNFSATNPQAPPLLTVNPSALLYTQLNGGAIANQGFLSAGRGQSLILAGGDIELNRSIMRTVGGRIELAGIAGTGTVGLNPDNSLSIPTDLQRADIALSNSEIAVSAGNNSGVAIHARKLDIAGNSRIISQVGSDVEAVNPQAGDLTLDATGTIQIREGSLITNYVAFGESGKGGNINVITGLLSLTDGSQIYASTFGEGDAGSVLVQAKGSVSAASNSYIFSNVEGGAKGNGGNINITALTLSLTDGSQLSTSVREAIDNQPAGFGIAGNVNVNVSGDITISGVKDGSSGIFSYLGTGAKGKGGSINVTTGSLSLSDGAQLIASTLGEGDAGSVLVQAKNSVSAAGNSYIFSDVAAGAKGNGGNINITAPTLSLTDGSQLSTSVREAINNQPAGFGIAGNVNVNVSGDVTISGVKNGILSGIFSYLGTGAKGKGGSINVTTGSLSLSDGAQLIASTLGEGDAGSVLVQAKNSVSAAGNSYIFSDVAAGAKGNGGNINITAPTLSLTDGSQVSTSVNKTFDNLPGGDGIAGNVNVNISGDVIISGRKNGIPSGIFSLLEMGAKGKGGSINVTTGSLSLSNGALLDATTFGTGDAGSVIIDARRVFLDGNNTTIYSSVETTGRGKGGDIRITTNLLSLTNGARLTASTLGEGDAGNIQINATDWVSVSGTSSSSGYSSAISTDTITNSTGKGGDITVNTNVLRVSDGAVLDAGTENNRNGGNITVSARLVEAINGGQLLTSTSSSGNAGKITVNASDSVNVNGSDATFNNRVAKFGTTVANPEAASGFFVRSEGSGIAGDIEVTSPQVTLDHQGKFIAESALGNGGNINLQASDFLLLRRGSQISTNAGTNQLGGDGGNITINTPIIVAVPNENSDITANAFSGRGGNISISAEAIFGIQQRSQQTPLSDITASSELGVDGTVQLNSPEVDPSRDVVELPTTPVDASTLVASGCPSGAENRFVVTGGGGLPPAPGDKLSADALLTDWATLTTSETGNRAAAEKPIPEAANTTTAPLVEATTWQFGSKGEVILTNADRTTPNSFEATPSNCLSS
ncbi:filamentous hemagglutinin [Cyanosarcina cf. burmensis CCALA 770]|nr:filamentous hemagglutinin [Cyanosarcina cf. burmensis CCALA 770]